MSPNDPDLELEDADDVDLAGLAPDIDALFKARGLRTPDLGRLIARPESIRTVDETPSAAIVPFGRTLAEVPYIKPTKPARIPGRF
jgi:hypothetical protein